MSDGIQVKFINLGKPSFGDHSSPSWRGPFHALFANPQRPDSVDLLRQFANEALLSVLFDPISAHQSASEVEPLTRPVRLV